MKEPRVIVALSRDGAQVIQCAGEFDMDTLAPLKIAVDNAAADPSVQRLVIDVARIQFADSSVLNLLLQIHRSERMVLAGPLPDQLARLFEMTGAGSVLTVRDSVEAAITDVPD